MYIDNFLFFMRTSHRGHAAMLGALLLHRWLGALPPLLVRLAGYGRVNQGWNHPRFEHLGKFRHACVVSAQFVFGPSRSIALPQWHWRCWNRWKMAGGLAERYPQRKRVRPNVLTPQLWATCILSSRWRFLVSICFNLLFPFYPFRFEFLLQVGVHFIPDLWIARGHMQ